MKYHKSKMFKRGDTIYCTTLCGRNRLLTVGMNIVEKDEDVTCKLCLKKMRKQNG